jgi:hypothetical protein
MGTDVDEESFIGKAEEVGADVICMSALLTTTMPFMQTVVDSLKERGIRDKYIVMVGGAPVNDTFAEQVGAANTDRTKYIVAGTLQDAEGNAIELAQWYGVDYIGEASLLAAVAPTLKSKLMHLEGTTYTSIDDSQLECVAGLAGAESYEVSFQLAAGVATDNWFSFDGANYTPVADVNAELAKVEPAKIYKSGMTYYYGDVKHLGSEGKVGEFGIVRNHSYKINVTGVKGLGTPVYDPEYRVENPVTPTDKESYISAKINVLSWRVVSSDVIL